MNLLETMFGRSKKIILEPQKQETITVKEPEPECELNSLRLTKYYDNYCIEIYSENKCYDPNATAFLLKEYPSLKHDKKYIWNTVTSVDKHGCPSARRYSGYDEAKAHLEDLLRKKIERDRIKKERDEFVPIHYYPPLPDKE